MSVWRIILFILLGSIFIYSQKNRLANGDTFIEWEKSQNYSKTYYVDNNSPNGTDNGPGSKEVPFLTIGKAAKILKAGERVIIKGGIYRESIQPENGGIGPEKMISYEAAEGENVIIKGSVKLNKGWKLSSGWYKQGFDEDDNNEEYNIWELPLDSIKFNGYNPFGMVNVIHDRYWLKYQEINMAPFFRRRGMVFVDGKPLEQMELYRELYNTGSRPLNAYSEDYVWNPIFEEMTGSAGKFWIENNGLKIHLILDDNNSPEDLDIEITVHEQVFAPKKRHLGYMRIKGLTFQHAGNGFPIPQRGLVSTNRGHHWIIEDCKIEWANGVALDIGKESWHAEDPEISGYHIIRNNEIRYAGICGIAGPSVENTIIENNIIEWIGWQDAQRMWESAGVKFHFATNLLFKNNIVRHLRYAAGIWLDVYNRNCRITNNVFTDISTISAAIQIEATHTLNQIDNNFVWGIREGHENELDIGNNGVGIFIQGTDKTMVNNNFVGECKGSGLYMVAVEDRIIGKRGGTSRNNKILNNFFYKCNKSAVEFSNPHNMADGNIYANMNGGYLVLNNPSPIKLLDLQAWREFYGWDKNGQDGRVSCSFDAENLVFDLKKIRNIDSDKTFGLIGKLNSIKQNIDPRK